MTTIAGFDLDHLTDVFIFGPLLTGRAGLVGVVLAPCVVLEPLGEVAAHELGDGHALVESGQVQAPEQVS